MDRERERRWKAEQAADRLVEHVRKLQLQLRESQCQQEQCVVREAQLQQKLREITENVETLKKDLGDVAAAATQKDSELQDLKTIESKHLEMLQKLEESCRILESEWQREKTELCSKLRESEVKAAACQREAESMRRSIRELKGQVHQLQELLASREGQHLKDMEKHKPLDGVEVSSHCTRCVLNHSFIVDY